MQLLEKDSSPELCYQIRRGSIASSRFCKLKDELPHIAVHCIDIRSGLNFPSNSFDVVLASLSLHYFTFIEMQYILKELKRVLKKNSMMIIRVNSVNDKNYGSKGYPEIEHHLFDVEGESKRFFNKEDIFYIFGDGWKICNLEEKTIDRFYKPKVVWEFVANSI